MGHTSDPQWRYDPEAHDDILRVMRAVVDNRRSDAVAEMVRQDWVWHGAEGKRAATAAFRDLRASVVAVARRERARSTTSSKRQSTRKERQ
jgi:hypothetical protein